MAGALATLLVALLSTAGPRAAEESPPGATRTAEPPQEKPPPARRAFVMTTPRECEIRGGEYVAPPDPQPDDLVDCLLPAQLRALGRQATGTGSPAILASVYHYLARPGGESPAYGLYSYVLFPGHSRRAEKLLTELFNTTPFAAIDGHSLRQLHVIQLPARRAKITALRQTLADGPAPPGTQFATEFYDYGLAQSLLVRICAEPADAVRRWCQSDLSRGPYLFTYAKPVSALSSVLPPYLVLDLSPVHERAFPEVLAAYKEQVKRADYTDMQRIETLRLRVLSIVLAAADWMDPMQRAMTSIVHLAAPDRGGATPAR